MYVYIYDFKYAWYEYLNSMYLCFVLSLYVYLIGWMDCPPLCCSERPPPDRRDPPGPGGRHRGQNHGTQTQQPLLINY